MIRSQMTSDRTKSPSQIAGRIEQLFQTLRETERKIQELTGQPLSASEKEGWRQQTESLRDYATIVDTAQRIGRMGSWSYDIRRNTLSWSEATCALFGITLAEFQGTLEYFRNFVLPEDLPALDAVLTANSPAQPFMEVEYRIRRADGSVRWMLDRGKVEFDAAGKAVRRIGMVMDVTEQRIAREQVEASAFLLRIAGKAACLGGWTIELPSRKLTWSDETCRIHDCPPGYQPTLDEGIAMFPPESREEVGRLVEACARDGTPYEFEVPKITATGRRIWVRSIGEAVRNAEGKIIRLQGAFQDITERKLAELELARSNRALRMMSACGVALIHAHEEASLLSEICRLVVELGGYRMAWVGYAREDKERTIEPMAHAGVEHGYLSIARLTWAEDDPRGRGPAGRAVRNGQLAVCANVAGDKDFLRWRAEALERGYQCIICLPLRHENRSFGVLALYSGEISQPGADELKLLQELADDLAFGIMSLRTRAERRKARQELAQKAALLDLATDAIVVRDLEGRVLFWNKGAERIYGWKAEEALGHSAQELLDKMPDGYEAAVKAVLKAGEWTGELEKRNRAGEAITLDCRWTLVRDEQGQPISVLCIETNATEKKKLETQLLRSQRMESIGTLAGGIAHDLNNVLAPIMVSIQMLRENARDTETAKVLGILEKSAERGAELIKQVLVFGRGIQGQRVEVNLTRLIRELQVIVREVFPKNIEFEFRIGRKSADVIGDPTQLHQVFLNLCVNARDAMPHGGKLTVGVDNAILTEADVLANPDARIGPQVVVSIADNGTGIPPAIRERIFEPFFTTKGPGKGTGLGLSTVLGIVRSHGGFITVASELGRGSTFKVYLPANESANVSDSTALQSSGLPRGNGELILLVDDEESVRSVVQITLELSGYRVITAINGAEALTLYTEQPNEISLVLTDMSMPVMDGLALIRALKKLNPDVRIIASSGYGSDSTTAEARNAGIRQFISKPYTAEALVETIHQELAEPAGRSRL